MVRDVRGSTLPKVTRLVRGFYGVLGFSDHPVVDPVDQGHLPLQDSEERGRSITVSYDLEIVRVTCSAIGVR
ncbi:MAG: hypothetical protein KKF56_03745 [Nanoarchaeota archaeon]|nr:hypothetical protein [Nanoarchaeota archaeon]